MGVVEYRRLPIARANNGGIEKEPQRSLGTEPLVRKLGSKAYIKLKAFLAFGRPGEAAEPFYLLLETQQTTRCTMSHQN